VPDSERVFRIPIPTLFSWGVKRLLTFNPSNDSDLYLSVGEVTIDIVITVQVQCVNSALSLASTQVSGYVIDLYDWSYDSGADPDRRLAKIQAGYGTLGDRGKVFRVQVNLDGDVPNLTLGFGAC